MKFRPLKRLIAAGAIATSAAVLLGTGVSQAATLGQYPQFFPTGVGAQQIRATGSETTYYVMNAIGNLFSQTSIYGCTLVTTDFRTCNTAGDGSATDTLDDYARTEFTNGEGIGSGNGIKQLCGVNPTGGLSLDFARASRLPNSGDGCPAAVPLQFAWDSVPGLVFPNDNTSAIACTTGSCTATQLGPVAAGWRTGNPFAGPYTGLAFANIDNTAISALGGRSVAFEIYCDKSTSAHVVTDATFTIASKSITSPSKQFTANDLGPITGAGIPAGTLVSAVNVATGVATITNATTAANTGTGESVTIGTGFGINDWGQLTDPTLDGTARVTVTDGVTNSTTKITSATANFSSVDLNAGVTGAGIPAGDKIVSITNATTAFLATAATATASGVSLTINDALGREGRGTAIGAPIYIPAVNTGSGTYSTWKGFVGCDPNTKNTDGQIIQENDGPQVHDIAFFDHATDNIAAQNQLASTIYYISYGVSQWQPYTATEGGSGIAGKETKINNVSASPAVELTQSIASFRGLYNIVLPGKVRGSVAGFLNWMCDTDPAGNTTPLGGPVAAGATHGLDLTTGSDYSTELTNLIGTQFVFPRVPCLADANGTSIPPVLAPGALLKTLTTNNNAALTSGSAIVTSASGNFTNGLVGATVTDTAGAIPAGTTVLSVQSPTQLTLTNNATITEAPAADTLTLSTRVFTDGATTSASTTLTSATANFTAADAGAFLTDSAGALPAGDHIVSVTNSTTVVLSAAATATASGDTVTVNKTLGLAAVSDLTS